MRRLLALLVTAIAPAVCAAPVTNVVQDTLGYIRPGASNDTNRVLGVTLIPDGLVLLDGGISNQTWISVGPGVPGKWGVAPGGGDAVQAGDLDQFHIGGTIGQIFVADGAFGGYWTNAGAGDVIQAAANTFTATNTASAIWYFADTVYLGTTNVVTALGSLNSATGALQTAVSANAGAISTLQTSTNALQVQVTNLGSVVGSNATAISTLQTSTNALQTQVTANTGKISTLQTSTNALQAQVTANAGAISTLQTSTNALQAQVTGLSGTVGSNGVAITALQAATNALQVQVSAVDTHLGTATNELISGTNALQVQVSAVDTHLGTATNELISGTNALQVQVAAVVGAVGSNDTAVLVLAGRVTTNETDIASLQTATNGLQTQIIGLSGHVGSATNELISGTNALQVQVSAVNTYLGTATNDLISGTNAIQTQVVDLSGTVGSNSSAIATLSPIVYTNEAAVADLQTATNGLQTQIFGLSGHLGTATNELIAGTNALQVQVAAVNTYLGTATNDLIASTNALQAQLNGVFLVGGNNTVTGTNTYTTNQYFQTVNVHDVALVTNGAPAHAEGLVFYDSDHHAVAYYNDDNDVTVQVGQELVRRVKNTTGGTLTNGMAVRITGGAAHAPEVGLSLADTEADSRCYGIVTSATIGPNQFGYVCEAGVVHELDTSMWSVGDQLFVSATQPGMLTNAAPSVAAGLWANHVATVEYVHGSEGQITVHLGDAFDSALVAGTRAANWDDATNKVVQLITATNALQAEIDGISGFSPDSSTTFTATNTFEAATYFWDPIYVDGTDIVTLISSIDGVSPSGNTTFTGTNTAEAAWYFNGGLYVNGTNIGDNVAFNSTAVTALLSATNALQTQVDGKLPLAGGTLTGDVYGTRFYVTNVTPNMENELATKKYVDDLTASGSLLLWLYGGVTSDVPPYRTASNVVFDAGTSFTNTYTSVTNNMYLSAYLAASNQFSKIPAGTTLTVHYHATRTGNANTDVSIRGELYRRTVAGVETNEVETGDTYTIQEAATEYEIQHIIVLDSDINFDPTDRLLVKLKVTAQSGNPNVSIITQGYTGSRISVPTDTAGTSLRFANLESATNALQVQVTAVDTHLGTATNNLISGTNALQTQVSSLSTFVGTATNNLISATNAIQAQAWANAAAVNTLQGQTSSYAHVDSVDTFTTTNTFAQNVYLASGAQLAVGATPTNALHVGGSATVVSNMYVGGAVKGGSTAYFASTVTGSKLLAYGSWNDSLMLLYSYNVTNGTKLGFAAYASATGDGYTTICDSNGTARVLMNSRYDQPSYWYTMGQSHKVGINTNVPTEALHVVGNGIFTGTLTVSGTNVGSQITGLIAGTNALQTAVSSLVTSTNALQTQIASLVSGTNALQTQVSALVTGTNALQTQVSTVASQVSTPPSYTNAFAANVTLNRANGTRQILFATGAVTIAISAGNALQQQEIWLGLRASNTVTWTGLGTTFTTNSSFRGFNFTNTARYSTIALISEYGSTNWYINQIDP